MKVLKNALIIFAIFTLLFGVIYTAVVTGIAQLFFPNQANGSKASALLLMYLFLFLTGGFAISLFEGLPVSDCLFEAASAIGTVGLSTGITPALGTASRVVLMCLMFFGRVGGLTFIFAAFKPRRDDLSRLPPEKINIG